VQPSVALSRHGAKPAARDAARRISAGRAYRGAPQTAGRPATIAACVAAIRASPENPRLRRRRLCAPLLPCRSAAARTTRARRDATRVYELFLAARTLAAEAPRRCTVCAAESTPRRRRRGACHADPWRPVALSWPLRWVGSSWMWVGLVRWYAIGAGSYCFWWLAESATDRGLRYGGTYRKRCGTKGKEKH